MAEETRFRIRIDPSDLAVEILSILIALVLATALNEWREHAQERHTASDALVQIRAEIAANRAELARKYPLHVRIARAFGPFADARDEQLTFAAFRRAFGAAAPHGISPFRGEETAWAVARSSGAVSHVDYATRVALEQAYQQQAFADEQSRRSVEIFRFGPVSGATNFYYVAFSFALDMNDLVYAERDLDAAYAKALRAIDTTPR